MLRCQSLLHYLLRNILNSTEDNGHLCRAATRVRKKSRTLPFSNTALVASSYNDLMTSIGRLSMLYFVNTRQKPSCQTRSNALKSKKFWWRHTTTSTIFFYSRTTAIQVHHQQSQEQNISGSRYQQWPRLGHDDDEAETEGKFVVWNHGLRQRPRSSRPFCSNDWRQICST